MSFKINIVFSIQENPTGGGNQFLKALRKGLRLLNVYAEQPDKADIFLFNSYQFIEQSFRLKLKFKDALFVHRIDGPIRLYNSMRDFRDTVTNTANHFLADATIFQSVWSQKENYRFGLTPTAYEAVIPNASDATVYNTINKNVFSANRRVKIVTTSWSSNWKKGFKIYQWLDDNLNFTKYEMTFIGNTPVSFRNIRHIAPLNGFDLANELKRHDIYITASQKDPCSNSLLEALNCGLPVIALNDGGHPEIVNCGGLLFARQEEIPAMLEHIIADYVGYQQRIRVHSLDEVVERYYSFLSAIWEAKNTGHYRSKSFRYLSQARLFGTLKWWPIRDRIIARINRVH